MRMPLICSSETDGILTFKRVWGFIPSCIKLLIIRRVKRAAKVKSISSENESRETAIDGFPIITPSAAAETVPEYNTSVPRLGPWLIPETMRSMSSGTSRLTASLTQSTGVPPMIQADLTSMILRGTTLMGSYTVIE